MRREDNITMNITTGVTLPSDLLYLHGIIALWHILIRCLETTVCSITNLLIILKNNDFVITLHFSVYFDDHSK